MLTIVVDYQSSTYSFKRFKDDNTHSYIVKHAVVFVFINQHQMFLRLQAMFTMLTARNSQQVLTARLASWLAVVQDVFDCLQTLTSVWSSLACVTTPATTPGALSAACVVQASPSSRTTGNTQQLRTLQFPTNQM